MALCLIVLLLPVIVVCGSALNGGRTMLFPPQDPSLQRSADFLVHEEVWVKSLRTSIIIALASASLATLMAWPIAYRLWRSGSRCSIHSSIRCFIRCRHSSF